MDKSRPGFPFLSGIGLFNVCEFSQRGNQPARPRKVIRAPTSDFPCFSRIPSKAKKEVKIRIAFEPRSLGIKAAKSSKEYEGDAAEAIQQCCYQP